MKIRSKLPDVGTTIFTVMSKLAVDHQAINLGQGFPGFPVDMKLADLVEHYIRKGYNQYAPMPGVPELRKTLSQKIRSMYGYAYDPDLEITITAGGTQAIFTAITAMIHRDDEVILFAPAYDCYAPAIELNGGKPVWIRMHYPDYRIDWQEVRSRVNEKTKMIIINSPHNPSGTCLSSEDMTELENIVAGSDICVISDEVYEHIIFDGALHQSAARYPALAQQSFLVYSFGKTFHNTGWKVGYICAPAAMMAEFRKVHQFNVFSCNTPVQYALNEYLSDENHYLTLPDFYQKKRDFFLSMIDGAEFTFTKSAGTYFQLLSYKNLSDESDVAIARRFTTDHKIASIPCSVFYPDGTDEKVLRFCFAKDNELLERAGQILRNIRF
jgi:methionine aminotransferase